MQCAYQVNRDFHSYDTDGKFNFFKSQFPHINMDKKKIMGYLKRFIKYSKENKNKINGTLHSLKKEFNFEAWSKIDASMKLNHTTGDCLACFPVAEEISLSSSSSPTTPSTLSICQPSPLSPSASCLVTPSTKSCHVTPSTQSVNLDDSGFSVIHTPNTPFRSLCISVPIPDKTLPDAEKIAAKLAIAKLDEGFKLAYGKPFTDLAPKVPGSKFQLKLTSVERKRKMRNLHKKVKQSIEKEMHSRDTNTLFGIRQTKAQYSKQRASLFLENKDLAKRRTEKVSCTNYL